MLDTDKLDRVVAHRGPIWIITRKDRIRTEDLITVARAGRRLERVMGAPGGENYLLYRIP